MLVRQMEIVREGPMTVLTHGDPRLISVDRDAMPRNSHQPCACASCGISRIDPQSMVKAPVSGHSHGKHIRNLDEYP
jgi:hypothetical protein